MKKIIAHFNDEDLYILSCLFHGRSVAAEGEEKIRIEKLADYFYKKCSDQKRKLIDQLKLTMKNNSEKFDHFKDVMKENLTTLQENIQKAN